MKSGEAKTKKRFLKTKRFRALIALVIAVGLATAGYLYMTKPSEGTIATSSIGQTGVLNAQTTNDHFTGATLGFDYPSNYQNMQKEQPSGSIAEQASLITHSGISGTQRLSITVKNRSSGSIQEDSAYQLRLRDAANYLHDTATVLGQPVDRFTRRDGTEITYFIPGSSYFALLSGTTSAPGQQLADDMSVVTSSFQWLK